MKEGASKATGYDSDRSADSSAIPGTDRDGHEERQEYYILQNRKNRRGESKCTSHREEWKTIAEHERMDWPCLPQDVSLLVKDYHKRVMT
jgi:hypothetical protein